MGDLAPRGPITRSEEGPAEFQTRWPGSPAGFEKNPFGRKLGRKASFVIYAPGTRPGRKLTGPVRLKMAGHTQYHQVGEIVIALIFVQMMDDQAVPTRPEPAAPFTRILPLFSDLPG